MSITSIPYKFLREHVRLSWRDVKFGLERQLASPNIAIDHATHRLTEPVDASADEVELASRSVNDEVLELVTRLAEAESEEPEESEPVQAKWLYLVLAWLFENRSSTSDPLALVEEVYSDFGYPAEVALFVRYMPMTGPDLGSREKNEARLYDYWKRYLEEASGRFAPQRPQ